MNIPMLAIDSNIEVSKQEQAVWMDQGIATVRVDSMQEAIEKLNMGEFLFVAINADSINYLPLLRVMRDITHLLIYVITSHYTANDYKEALDNGADAYVAFLGTAKENVQTAMALLNRHSERSTLPKKPMKIITYRGLLVYPKFRRVFYRDAEIDLTKTEYDIFNCLLSNANQTLPPDLLCRKVWGKECDEVSRQVLWQHMYRLRQKFKAAQHEGCIESRRGTGYCFSTREKK